MTTIDSHFRGGDVPLPVFRYVTQGRYVMWHAKVPSGSNFRACTDKGGGEENF